MKPIGFVSVDSGLLLFADPCHVLTESEYERIVIHNYTNKEEIARDEFSGVIVHSPVGDGHFPVYAIKDNDGNVVRLVIEFDREMETEE